MLHSGIPAIYLSEQWVGFVRIIHYLFSLKVATTNCFVKTLKSVRRFNVQVLHAKLDLYNPDTLLQYKNIVSTFRYEWNADIRTACGYGYFEWNAGFGVQELHVHRHVLSSFHMKVTV